MRCCSLLSLLVSFACTVAPLAAAGSASAPPASMFHGVELCQRDAGVLQALERLIGEPPVPVARVGIETYGFVVRDGTVVELGLYKKDLRELPGCVTDLADLERLG